jgi:hypothetical protein
MLSNASICNSLDQCWIVRDEQENADEEKYLLIFDGHRVFVSMLVLNGLHRD